MKETLLTDTSVPVGEHTDTSVNPVGEHTDTPVNISLQD